MHDLAIVVRPSRLEDVELEASPSSSRSPTCVVKQGVKKLRNKVVRMVRVKWGNDPTESTWEPKEKI